MGVESKIQYKITKYLESLGYIVVNLTTTNKNGIPDLIATRNSFHFWIEVKKPGGVVSKLQEYRIKKLRNNGDTVLIPYRYEEFITLYNNLGII